MCEPKIVRTFVGRGPFPLDMLQYEKCFPKSYTDAVTIHYSLVDRQSDIVREVTLCKCDKNFDLFRWAYTTWTPKIP